MRAATLIAVLFAAGLSAGCSSFVRWSGVQLLYDRAESPGGTRLDLVYVEGSEDPKHRLDLYLPAGEGWPVLLFAPGGGWQRGDKQLIVSGADVYGNIGRFYASRGIGTAVVNYRLQPEVTWRDQVADVARAVAWAREHIGEYGGDPSALFLSGHSAGAYLSAMTALDPAPLGALGLAPSVLCGVIPVSGLAFDLADERTYELGAERPYYEERFRGDDPGDGWLREASVTTYITAEAPPFRLIHGAREWKALGHQNRLFDQALRDGGATSELRVARQQTHAMMVLALSRDKRLPSTVVLDFIRGSRCRQPAP